MDGEAALIALLGLLGNYANFKTARHIPVAKSKFLIRYLAVWDTLAAPEATVNKHLSYK